MYQKELAKSGKFIFKIRGEFLNTITIISVIIAYISGTSGPFESSSSNLIWFWISFGVAVSGALIRIVTSGYAALGTSGVNKVAAIAAELNTTGPYSLVRNPLYLGRIINFTGIAMLSGSWVYGSLIFLISILVYERISVYEEEFLREEFGHEAHDEWSKHVPFLLPRIKGWKTPKYPFWIKRCIMREDKKVLWLITAVVGCDFAMLSFDVNQLPENLIWYYTWALIAFAYVVIRGLRHLTKTFDGIS